MKSQLTYFAQQVQLGADSDWRESEGLGRKSGGTWDVEDDAGHWYVLLHLFRAIMALTCSSRGRRALRYLAAALCSEGQALPSSSPSATRVQASALGDDGSAALRLHPRILAFVVWGLVFKHRGGRCPRLLPLPLAFKASALGDER